MQRNGNPHRQAGRQHGQPPRVGIGLVGGPGDLGHPGDEFVADPKQDVVGTFHRAGHGCHRKAGPLRALGRHQAAHLLDGGSDLVIVDGHDWHANLSRRCGAIRLGAGHPNDYALPADGR